MDTRPARFILLILSPSFLFITIHGSFLLSA
jgi:hypothetical protein